MKLTREGNRLTNEEIHSICKYYEDNIDLYSGYGSVKRIVIDALSNAHLPLTDSMFRSASRLYYKRDSKDICDLYNY